MGRQKIQSGDTFKTNQGYMAEVIHYENSNNVLVKFSTGNTTKTKACHLRSGLVKNRLHRSVYGIGFLGEGSFNKRNSFIAYQHWANLLKRCHSASFQNTNPSYVGCNVDPRWHNFQTFAEWFSINSVDGWDIDKDLLSTGNKTYSPDLCVFLPREINVSIRPAAGAFYFRRDNNYTAQINKNGKSAYLGYFDTKDEAQSAYIKAKKEYVLSLAEKHKAKLSKLAYEALTLWQPIAD